MQKCMHGVGDEVLVGRVWFVVSRPRGFHRAAIAVPVLMQFGELHVVER